MSDYRMHCSLDECEACGSRRNGRAIRKYETRDGNDVLIHCSDCEKFCPICNQSLNTDDAGYCYHCKEPVIDVVFTGKVFDYLK